jgi:tetratricopeptide (TPR) repeat protein
VRVVMLFLLGSLILPLSCAHQKKPDIDTETAGRKTEILQAERAAAQYLSAGDFEKALDAYKEVSGKYRKDSQVRKGISGVMEAIKKMADVSYRKGDFAASGKLSRILLKNVHLKGPGGTPFFDAGAVARHLADCSERLTRRGLEYYRKGELKRAIAIWKNVLEFDPDNVEVRNAADTASAQLRNLR